MIDVHAGNEFMYNFTTKIFSKARHLWLKSARYRSKQASDKFHVMHPCLETLFLKCLMHWQFNIKVCQECTKNIDSNNCIVLTAITE